MITIKEADKMPRHKQSDPQSVKSQVIRLRVTQAEAQLFKANAAEAGCKSISEYIRMKCIGEDSDGVDIAATATEHPTSVEKEQAKK